MPNPPNTSEWKVRFVPLGGIVGVTKNMYLYELYRAGELQDILIVDCGIGFPDADELGVDIIIPDISYLKDKLNKIRAIILTHGHEDHIGALPYHYADLGSPPIYTAKLTAMFVENKMAETKDKPTIVTITLRKPYTFGGFTVKFLNMTHSIPDTTHLVIQTPVGVIYHGPDFKLDVTPPYGDPPDFYEICKAGHDGVVALMSDALGSFREGLTLSESAIGASFEHEMRRTKGKFIMTTIASNISRIRQCVEAAVKFNRKVIFLGRSMQKNTLTAAEIGYLPIPPNLVGDEKEVMKLPPNKVCVIATGAFGQEGSAIARIAMGTHKTVKALAGDTVLFSADPIPGVEEAVYSIIEELTVRGVNVVYSEVAEQLHASGHGSIDDLKFLLRFVNPRYAIPIGSTIRHHMQYQKLAEDLGMRKENVFLLREGETLTFAGGGKANVSETIETENIYVDAYGVGDVGTSVLRDRKSLASDGIVVTLVTIDKQNKIIGMPLMVNRGFVYEKTDGGLLDEAAQRVMKFVTDRSTSTVPDVVNLKKDIAKDLELFFKQATGRLPLVVVEVLIV